MKKSFSTVFIVLSICAMDLPVESRADPSSTDNMHANISQFRSFPMPNNSWALLDVIAADGHESVSSQSCGAPEAAKTDNSIITEMDFTDKDDRKAAVALSFTRHTAADIGFVLKYRGVKKVSINYINPTLTYIDEPDAKKVVSSWSQECVSSMERFSSQIITQIIHVDGVKYSFEDDKGMKVQFDPDYVKSLPISDEQKAQLTTDSSLTVSSPMEIGYKGFRVTENWIPCKKGHAFWCN